MTTGNAAVLSRFFEEFSRVLAGDGDLLDVAHRYVEPDCVAELGVFEGDVVGPEGIVRYFEGQLAVVDGMHIDPEELIEIGDRVVVPFRLTGRAKETGLPIDFRYTQLFTLRGGRLAHIRMYADKERALAAAGAAAGNAQVIREYFEEVNRAFAEGGDVLPIAERYVAPDCVAELGAMEGDVVGPEGMAHYLEGQLAIVEGMQVEPLELIEIGDQVVMPFSLTGRARETGLPIEFRYTQLFTMRDGRFAHARMYADKEHALAAAGAGE